MEPLRPLVSARWLAEHADEVTIFDSRLYLDGRSPREAYERGHIPGAVFVDLDADLAAPPSQPGGRHPFPTPSHFAAAMGRLGFDGGHPAVVYDDVGGGMAARLWFMLHLLDVPVAVLDGGIQAWSGPLETGSPPVIATTFQERPWPSDRLISADDVAARIAAGGVVVDARNASRYSGKPNRIDPRFGHVPGAINLPWEDNIDDFTGTMLQLDELGSRYREVLEATPDRPRPAAYCGPASPPVTICSCSPCSAWKPISTSARGASGAPIPTDPSQPTELRRARCTPG